MINQIPSIERYNKNLLATLDWLIRSCEKGNGGSSAYYSPIKKWSGPYPETTGYIIPTLINASHHFKVDKYNKLALGLGEWLLGLQNADGSWPGGVYVEGSRNEPSVFNTAQILDGMVALFDLTKDEKWLMLQTMVQFGSQITLILWETGKLVITDKELTQVIIRK